MCGALNFPLRRGCGGSCVRTGMGSDCYLCEVRADRWPVPRDVRAAATLAVSRPGSPMSRRMSVLSARGPYPQGTAASTGKNFPTKRSVSRHICICQLLCRIIRFHPAPSTVPRPEELTVAFAGASAPVFSIMQTTTVDIGGSAQLLGPTGQRRYLNTTSNNPSPIPAWPSDLTSPAAVSIRPALYELTQGNMDSQLHDFLMGAPAAPAAPSLVGMWHEASTQGPNKAYAPYFSSLDQNFPNQHGAHGLLTKAQMYVQGKARDWGANMKVGAIEVNQATTDASAWSNLNQWMAPGLDFYATDTYDGKDGTSVPADLM